MAVQISGGVDTLFSRINKLLVLIFILCGAAALAQSNASINKVEESEWECHSLSDWELEQIVISENIIINNFMFTERSAYMAATLNVFEVSYSITNRSNRDIAYNSQAAGFDDDMLPTFALNMDPTFDIISGNGSETISGDTYFVRSSSVIDKTKFVCMLFVLDS